jgi:hypothetical protein
MLRIFSPEKIRRLQPGVNPQYWVPEDSMLTTRPPKLCGRDRQKVKVKIQPRLNQIFITKANNLMSFREKYYGLF